MGSKFWNVGLVMALLAISLARAKAQAGCTSVLLGMAPCLNFVTGSSSTPSTPCCSQLARVVQSQPQCLCTALTGGAGSLGVTINQTQALALPGACNVQTPPVSQCKANIVPAMSPVASPVGSPEASPEDNSNGSPISGAGAGSKTVPSAAGNSSVGAVKKPILLPLFLLLLFSYALTS